MKAKLIKHESGYLLYDEDNNTIGIEPNVLSSDGFSKLSFKNCQAIERGYDLDELADILLEEEQTPHKLNQPNTFRRGVIKGFQKALSILGDKRFSEVDVISMIEKSRETGLTAEYLILNNQQTEWDVEIVMEKDCYSSAGRCDNSTMADCIICTPVTYLKDADGCLILKRI